ncbi:anthranilate synthase component I family protein [Agathobaculum sp.]|uniref:anthranilate synthase component I family protein n=1 Tax=Agathobaculum sp. TaxID=2048138 RepID=UPI0027BA98DA|nr:chorismate-binding protein [Agathobaculum sp.]
MITPGCDEIVKLAAEYSTIPVCREIYADMTTPIALLRRLQARSKRFFLLESVEGGEKWARYSFLGYDPILRATCKNGTVTLEGVQNRTVQTDKPLDVLREVLAGYRAPRIEGLPPFTGGFVGYFAYAMLGYAEPRLRIKRGDWDDFDLLLFDKVIAYDHFRQKIVLIVNMRTDSVMENYGRACAELESMAALVNDQSPLPPQQVTEQPRFTCNVTEAQYAEIVNKTREYIFDGDIFQAVQSRRFVSPYAGSLLPAYRVLRTTNPSPYMVFLSIDGDEIMCSSPETLVRLQDGRLTTFPVAGSRPRGTTPAEDKALERELLADEKELSEHNMLVDLGRNDLGRVSEIGSVEVTEYMMIHRYSKIMHICSQVEGDLADGCDALDALASVLPAGTLSGAPKIRACEIIEELEHEPRGVYGGALGYLDFAGNMDTCIAIRMAARKNGVVTVQAGGGIVADSVPENEYLESANKARAVINAIERAAEVDG